MAHIMVHRLSAAFCRNIKHSGNTKGPERHGDGHGLALCVTPGGSRHWVQRIVIRGQRRTFGLGSYPRVSLAQARQIALKNRNIAREGGDPLEARARGDVPTFREAAEAVIELRSAAWRPGSKSPAQWRSSLAAYAYPVLGDRRVSDITTADVLAVIEPIWNKRRETASRVRQRISAVMQRGIVQGHRRDDPAAAVLTGLPRTGHAVRHHRALPYQEVPAALRKIQGTGAWLGTKMSFAFLVLTAARSGEVRGATWDEIDIETRLWTVPAERMKAKKPHRVPLSGPCMEILTEAREIATLPALGYLAGCPLVFPSVRGRPLSDSTVSKLCRENGLKAVPHGFRSSFRDWAAEQTDAPHAAMESALAHSIPRAVERAYARSDLLDKRRSLMEDWAEFVCQEPGEVVVVGGGRA